MQTNSDFQVRAAVSYKVNQGDIVFFRIDVNELFGITLDYPGIRTCLNNAFVGCKKYIPYDTGITYRSFTKKKINDHIMEYFFDPNKVIGQNRKGKIVEQYYVQYIASTPKNYSWLTKVIYEFYEIMFKEVGQLKRARKKINDAKVNKVYLSGGEIIYAMPEQEIETKTAKVFLTRVREEFKTKQDEAKRMKQIEKENKKAKLEKRINAKNGGHK